MTTGSQLRTDYIDAKPLDRDWVAIGDNLGETWDIVAPSDALDEDGAHDTLYYDGGGTVAVCKACGDRQADIDAETECYACGADPADWEEVEVPSEESLYPVMNYAYPIGLGTALDQHEAAQRVIDAGPFSLVWFDDGSYYFALTGGGMDFSWEICRAYISLGYYPPAHFAGRLPRLAGLPQDAANILAVCKKSLEIQRRWIDNNLDYLATLAQSVKVEGENVRG